MRIFLVCWALMACVAGCGSGGAPKDCPDLVADFQGCGGDLVANWNIDRACVGEIQADHILFTACPSATLSGGMESAGELHITADSFRPDFTQQVFTFHLEIPLDCLAPLALTCAFVEDEINTDPETSGTCAEDGDLCICDAQQDLIDEWTGEMSYSHLPNHKLLLTDAEDYEYRIPYCVTGRRATLEIEFYTSQGSAMVYFTGTR